MALIVNSKAPDFTLPSTKGNFTLSKDFSGKPCILYFYPKGFTKGCTKEACSFRDEFSIFKTLGIDIVGISRDSVETHLRFKKQYALPFALLADKNGAVAKKYKALMPIISVTKRITYLLDKNHVIKAVYDKLFDADEHVSAMLAKAKTLQK